MIAAIHAGMRFAAYCECVRQVRNLRTMLADAASRGQNAPRGRWNGGLVWLPMWTNPDTN